MLCADVHNKVRSELTGNYKIITEFVTASEKIILSNDLYTRPDTEKSCFRSRRLNVAQRSSIPDWMGLLFGRIVWGRNRLKLKTQKSFCSRNLLLSIRSIVFIICNDLRRLKFHRLWVLGWNLISKFWQHGFFLAALQTRHVTSIFGNLNICSSCEVTTFYCR